MMETLTAWAPRALSVLRIITGLMIIQHGMAKLLGFPVVASFANLSPFSLIGKKKGTSVEVMAPGGAKAYEITKVEWRA